MLKRIAMRMRMRMRMWMRMRMRLRMMIQHSEIPASCDCYNLSQTSSHTSPCPSW